MAMLPVRLFTHCLNAWAALICGLSAMPGGAAHPTNGAMLIHMVFSDNPVFPESK
ncbi:hypothetical protein [Massilia sp. X63]|uniref:hypothetical protein n=1 Tax=Massilia sp. X63 TaxID=3237285 RepID=UPI0034DD018C